MATTLRLQDLSSTLTPPPSDRGDCIDDTSMLNTESYLGEVFYPSPAPSYTQYRSAFSHSPETTPRDSTYDTDEDHQHLMFTGATSQMYTSGATIPNVDVYTSDMAYQQFGQNWLPYNSFHNQSQMYPYTNDEASNVFGYVSQAPSAVLPPMPEGVSGGNLNFHNHMKHESTPSFLPPFTTPEVQSRSPAVRSTSISGVSSRSCSPSLSLHGRSSSQTSRSVRSSVVSHRSSSSSLHAYGIPVRAPGSTSVQAWKCAYPNCTSRAVFTRGCDLRKHYNRHSKHLFCRVDGCPQSEAACIAAAQQQAIQACGEPSDPSKLAISGGFSSKKDRARHEAKHNPGIKCEWSGPNGEECGRLFSRMDNMKDHVRRIHNKGQPHTTSQHSRTKSR